MLIIIMTTHSALLMYGEYLRERRYRLSMYHTKVKPQLVSAMINCGIGADLL